MSNIVYVGKHALTWTVSRHYHKDWELIYCTSGGGKIIFAGQALLPVYGQLVAAFLSKHQPRHRHSEAVQQIEDDILRHYPDCTYDLNAQLSSLPFNTEYLKKMFKKETGLTPLQYLTNKRLENAASTLASFCGKGNISETAMMCGFSDPLYFSRLFKKRYGVSPRNYLAEAAAPAPPPDRCRPGSVRLN